MPTAPPRACGRCGALITGPCSTCTRQRDEHRGSAHARGYDKAWGRLSRDFRSRFPFCGMRADGNFYGIHSQCVRRGLRILAQCTDHIVPVRDGGAILDENNLQALCFACNTRKG